MRSISLTAPAKINLYLEIIGLRPDGYHELVMVLQSIALADRLELHPNGKEETRLYCSNSQVPLDQTNIAYKAVQLITSEYPEIASNYGGIDIIIDKQIPVAAGLAGGSSNGAAVLVGLNLLWNLGLTQPEIETLAAQLGSDVPFCVAGGTAIATGRGEKLAPIPSGDDLWLVLAKYQSLSVSTPWAYQQYRQEYSHTYLQDLQGETTRKDVVHSGPLVKAITHKQHQQIGQLLHNDLEKVVLPAYPLVGHLRDTLEKTGGLGTMMSGSGPSVFTLCESQKEAETILDKVRESIPDSDLQLWITKLANRGINIDYD